jgi:hypothetical protein
LCVNGCGSNDCETLDAAHTAPYKYCKSLKIP